MSEQAVHDWIRKTVANNDVVLFMKGTKDFPNAASPPRWPRSLATSASPTAT